MKIKVTALMIFLVLWPGADLASDTLFLKNGNRIGNVFTWEEGQMIMCLKEGQVFGVYKKDVDRVRSGKVTGGPPHKKKKNPGKSRRKKNIIKGAGSRFFNVTRVFDGDSFMASDGNIDIHVRIVGIDAPEKENRGMPAQPYAGEAEALLTRLILNRKIRVKGFGTGFYNRQLAEVFKGDLNVGLEMVRSGLAEVYTGNLEPGLDAAKYQRAEQMAREQLKEIWSQGEDYVSPRSWRRFHRR